MARFNVVANKLVQCVFSYEADTWEEAVEMFHRDEERGNLNDEWRSEVIEEHAEIIEIYDQEE